MGVCDISYTYIAPDGETFALSDAGLVPGSSASLEPLEGQGLPPLEYVSQDIYQVPGQLVRDVIVQPRSLTFVASLYSDSRLGLWRVRARLYDALRPGRGPSRVSPGILRVNANGVVRDINVHYAAMVEQQQGRYGKNVTIAVRFVSFDSFWYDPVTHEQVLDWADTMLVRLAMAKVDGVWDNLGPPAAVAAGAGATTSIHAVTVSPDGNYVYFGGDFQTFDNIAAANHVVRWNIATQAWEAVGGGLNHIVRCLYFGPDGVLYAGGTFTNGSGGAGDGAADYVAQLNPATNTWVNVGGGPGAGAVVSVYDVVIGHDGTLYIGGDFTDWDGVLAADYLARLPLPYAGGAWAAVGGAFDAIVRALAVLPTGNIVAGGAFATIGGVAYVRIAEWDPVGAAWSTLGSGLSGAVYDLCVGVDGSLYAGGLFGATADLSVALNYIGRWNGASWLAMVGGLSAQVAQVAAHPNGEIYASGLFTNAGGTPFADYAARWNGFAWIPLDIVIPAPAATAPRFATTADGDLYLGTDALAVNIPTGADNVIVNAGNAPSLPIIEIKNAGQLGLIINEAVGGSDTTKREIPMNMLMLDGEIVTIDLSTGRKSCDSNWRGNRLGDILPGDDLGSFKLESNPRAQYGGVEGANLVTVFITDAAAREHNDGGNQLSGWDNITGISQHNTNLGILYASIVAGVTNHVNLYTDAARTLLVAHTDDYNAAGAVVVNEDNGSGLGGTITVDAGGWPGANDTDIYVYYTIVTMFWTPRWWSLDEAVASVAP